MTDDEFFEAASRSIEAKHKRYREQQQAIREKKRKEREKKRKEEREATMAYLDISEENYWLAMDAIGGDMEALKKLLDDIRARI